MVFNTSWHLESKPHAKQLDSCNCGVYCLMFAERHLSGDSLLDISLKDVEAKRREIGCTFLLYEVYLDEQCPCCGFQTSNENKSNLLQCRNCGRYFHKKNRCVGMMALTKERTFLCHECKSGDRKI
ncbi:uncharacterized protein LOC117314766 [Pecten maximus]|uniref:uncharacterized protein LOC117314766 n=1 Tax=Pecten maximus TaxID=6579 RepID=UPI001458064E|nr:uncharacterized protein LOC117314766 [Pecten maximus]XP_033724764.1 uncharacterized protein LOC117314766 [Pecten maximus]